MSRVRAPVEMRACRVFRKVPDLTATPYDPEGNLLIHHSSPWNITVSRVFALSILSTSFPPYPWNSNASKDFHFGVTFIRLSFCKPRQGIGPWSPMSNFSDFNALVFSVLSTLSTFCKKHYKGGLSEQLVRWCRLPPFYYNIFVVNTPNIQLGCYPSCCLSC